jgi:phosphoribosylaminoimidazolecarboxamide formyltransferase/IMP cyclohydrolase
LVQKCCPPGGTAKALREAGVAVTDVAAYTGSPEILDGRVKTLHPKIHGGLLGRRGVPDHVKQMQQHGIGNIDVVVVNLYPFEATIAKPNCPFEEAIENIDIGGPSMLRSAAKNHEDVLVVVDPSDYTRVLEAVKAGSVTPALRRELAMKVFQHTARYDSLIAGYLEKQVQGSEVKFPAMLSLQFERVETLRYGENPHQQGAFYRELHAKEPAVSRGKILHGKAMSYNNFLDANSALELVKEFDQTAVAIIKHNNPCGCALGATPVEAYVKSASNGSRLSVRRCPCVQPPGGSGRGERNHLDLRGSRHRAGIYRGGLGRTQSGRRTSGCWMWDR